MSHEDGLGVLCVLHQPELARRFADRILGMKDGRIRFDTKPAEVQEAEVAGLYIKTPEAVAA